MPMFALNATIEDLEGTWLKIQCCNGVAYLPLRLLGGVSRRQAPLYSLMRCKPATGRHTAWRWSIGRLA